MKVTAASIVFRYLLNTAQLVETLVKVDGDSPFQKQCVSIKKTKGVAAFEELVLGTKLSTAFKLVGEPARTLRESLRTDKASNWRKAHFGTFATLPQMLVRTTPAYSNTNTLATASLDPELVTSIQIFSGERDISNDKNEIEAIARCLGYCATALEEVPFVVKFLNQHLSSFDRQKFEITMGKSLNRKVRLLSMDEGCVETTIMVPRYVAEAFLDESDFSKLEAQFGKLVAWIDKPIPLNPTAEAFSDELAHCSTPLEKFVVLRAYFRSVAAQNAHILFKDTLDERCLDRACNILDSILRSPVLREKAGKLTKVTLYPNECERLWNICNCSLELYSGNPMVGENRFAFAMFGVITETILACVILDSSPICAQELKPDGQCRLVVDVGIDDHRNSERIDVQKLLEHLLSYKSKLERFLRIRHGLNVPEIDNVVEEVFFDFIVKHSNRKSLLYVGHLWVHLTRMAERMAKQLLSSDKRYSRILLESSFTIPTPTEWEAISNHDIDLQWLKDVSVKVYLRHLRDRGWDPIASLHITNVGKETFLLMKSSAWGHKRLEIMWNLEMINRVPLLARDGQLIAADIRQCQDWEKYLSAIQFFVDRIPSEYWLPQMGELWE